MHVLNPKFVPTKYLVSQYATGQHGWVIQVALYCFSLSCLAAGLAIWEVSVGGALLLFISALGTAGASFFVTDPVGTQHGSRESRLHLLSTYFVIPIFPLAAALVGQTTSDRLLEILTKSVWLAFVIFIGALVGSHREWLIGKVTVGIFQRILLIVYALWLLALTRGLLNLMG